MSSDDEQVIPNVNGDPETPPTAVSRPSKAAAHPKYYDMLVEAIKALDEKKGASVIAIKHWIIQTYPELEQSRMKNLLRMAIKRGVDSGAIVRPKKSEAIGAALTGRYKLGKPPKPAKKAVEKKKKVEKKKAAVVGKKKKIAKSPTAKKGRKESDHDIFDYEDDTEGSDPDGGKTPPPYRKNRAKKIPVEKSKTKKAVEIRPRSSSANATPKPRVSKSRAIMRRSKSQSPAPSKIKKALKKPVSKSPAKKLKAKSPAKKPKAKAATSKASPAASAKAKKLAVKKKDKTPTKKAVKTTKKKIIK